MADISVFTVLGTLLFGWVLFPLFVPVHGIYRRTDVEEEEYLELVQFGPIISGKRNVDGGNQLYSGFQTFWWLKLKRRDYGLPALIAQGFPEIIAKKINGTITARLKLSRSGRVLRGTLIPQKILFDEATERVLSRRYEGAAGRAFEKTNLTELPVLKAQGVAQTNLPPPDKVKQKRKKTF